MGLTMTNWNEYGGIFVTWPGSNPGYCAVVNAATGAWGRIVGYDATCFLRMRADMFFGTQTGLIMQADRTGYDDGQPYVAVLVGGWEMFASPPNTITWRQARASFSAANGQPFQPQLSATGLRRHAAAAAAGGSPDPPVLDVWDRACGDRTKVPAAARADAGRVGAAMDQPAPGSGGAIRCGFLLGLPGSPTRGRQVTVAQQQPDVG
jgi:hypothetical protein